MCIQFITLRLKYICCLLFLQSSRLQVWDLKTLRLLFSKELRMSRRLVQISFHTAGIPVWTWDKSWSTLFDLFGTAYHFIGFSWVGLPRFQHFIQGWDSLKFIEESFIWVNFIEGALGSRANVSARYIASDFINRVLCLVKRPIHYSNFEFYFKSKRITFSL